MLVTISAAARGFAGASTNAADRRKPRRRPLHCRDVARGPERLSGGLGLNNARSSTKSSTSSLCGQTTDPADCRRAGPASPPPARTTIPMLRRCRRVPGLQAGDDFGEARLALEASTSFQQSARAAGTRDDAFHVWTTFYDRFPGNPIATPAGCSATTNPGQYRIDGAPVRIIHGGRQRPVHC